MPRPRLKICCISSQEEARLAIDAGADVLGLVSAMPSGPGVIAEETIADIAGITPPGVATFLLSSLQTHDDIVAQHARCRTTAIQLCDVLTDTTHRDLLKSMPGVGIVQVIHVIDESSVDEAIAAIGTGAQALLLDSGDPRKATKELGGTGRRHDWEISRKIVGQSPIPVYLAGGLSHANVSDAYVAIRPFGFDVCSGVRSEGRLNPDLLQRLAESIRVLG